MTLVKVCGLRSLTDARSALAAGANLLGFIFWKPGRRYVSPDEAAIVIRTLRAESSTSSAESSAWSAVGVFVDPSPQEVEYATDVCGLDVIQLSGGEGADTVAAMPRPTLKAIHVRAGQEAAAAETVATDALRAKLYLLDTHADGVPGGTGATFDWAALQSVGPRCLVAGGLRPDNVSHALATLKPLGVDVSSGVEFPQAAGGGKDPRLIQAFLKAVRTYDQRKP